MNKAVVYIWIGVIAVLAASVPFILNITRESASSTDAIPDEEVSSADASLLVPEAPEPEPAPIDEPEQFPSAGSDGTVRAGGAEPSPAPTPPAVPGQAPPPNPNPVPQPALVNPPVASPPPASPPPTPPSPEPPPPPPAPPPGPAPVAVGIQNFTFTPDVIEIDSGTTVIWTNADNASHTVASDGSGPLASPVLGAGQSFSFTFQTADAFPYHCSLHPSMVGIIIVGDGE